MFFGYFRGLIWAFWGEIWGRVGGIFWGIGRGIFRTLLGHFMGACLSILRGPGALWGFFGASFGGCLGYFGLFCAFFA